jgi:hypothetical protein
MLEGSRRRILVLRTIPEEATMFRQQQSQPIPANSLRGAVIGNGTALTHTPDGRLQLYDLADGHVQYVGSFDNPGRALAALDALDEAA